MSKAARKGALLKKNPNLAHFNPEKRQNVSSGFTFMNTINVGTEKTSQGALTPFSMHPYVGHRGELFFMFLFFG